MKRQFAIRGHYEEYYDDEGDIVTLCLIDIDFFGENILCALVDEEHLEECIKHHNWDMLPGDARKKLYLYKIVWGECPYDI